MIYWRFKTVTCAHFGYSYFHLYVYIVYTYECLCLYRWMDITHFKHVCQGSSFIVVPHPLPPHVTARESTLG